MDTADTFHSPDASPDGPQSIRCAACESALDSPGRESVSFLLLDHLTVPLVGCDDHLEQFSALCGLATESSPELLDHRPAGGITCPGCRHAAYDTHQPIVPVDGGGLALLACDTHQSAVIDRFRTGLRVQRQLTSSIEASSTDP